MKLKDLVKKLYVGIAGDRLDLISKFGILIGGYKTFESFAPELVSKNIDESSLWIVPFYLSASLMGATLLGWPTLKSYNRTIKHIEKFGRVDDSYFITITRKYEKRRFVGYCPLQGIYLAMKENGITEDFQRLKREYTKNIIPNF